MTAKFCFQCGDNVQFGAQFCSNCGVGILPEAGRGTEGVVQIGAAHDFSSVASNNQYPVASSPVQSLADRKGRLVAASGSGHQFSYGFGVTSCSGPANDPQAGLNSNRVSVTDNGVVVQVVSRR